MLQQAKKWVKEFSRPYKYADQKTKDQMQLIDGIVNFVAGLFGLIFKLVNLMLIVPIKALVLDPKNFTTKYKEIGEGDIKTIIPTFRRLITGIVQTLTSPLIPFRIIIRWFLTPVEGVSVFANAGLKRLVDDYLKNTPELKQDGIKTFAIREDKLPNNITKKTEKYNINKQKDSDELSQILAKPMLTYYKMREINARIEQEHVAKDCRVNTANINISI